MAGPNSATLTKIFSDVLANLAFLFEDGAPVLGAAAPADAWHTRIRYFGPCAGVLSLTSPPAFAELLAANLLGLERDDPALAVHAEDAVKEFMNILCGQFITAVHGTEEVFNLSIPQVDMVAGTWTAGAVQTSQLWVEGHPVRVAWFALAPSAATLSEGSNPA